MASAEIERTLKKITDTQLVIVRLMETNERKWERRFEAQQGRSEAQRERTEDLGRAAAQLHRSIDKLWHVVEAHEQKSEHLRRLAEAHEQRLDDGEEQTAALRDAVRTMLASMDSLMKTLEDLTKGRKRENGRRR